MTAKECEERKKAASKKVKDLQDKLKDAKATRERELKAAEAEVKKAKDKMDKSSKQMKGQEQVSFQNIMPSRQKRYFNTNVCETWIAIFDILVSKVIK